MKNIIALAVLFVGFGCATGPHLPGHRTLNGYYDARIAYNSEEHCGPKLVHSIPFHRAQCDGEVRYNSLTEQTSVDIECVDEAGDPELVIKGTFKYAEYGPAYYLIEGVALSDVGCDFQPVRVVLAPQGQLPEGAMDGDDSVIWLLVSEGGPRAFDEPEEE